VLINLIVHDSGSNLKIIASGEKGYLDFVVLWPDDKV
jgi:hypothetical protein